MPMRIAYVVKEFPRLSETFILTELLELERRGHEVVVYSRHPPQEEVPHETLGALRARAVQLKPLLRDELWKSFAAHLDASKRLGRIYEDGMARAIALKSRNEMRYWILAGEVARQLTVRGVDLIHAHFATGSASLARYASRLSGIPFTFTAHAKDIYADTVNRDRLRDLMEEAAAVVTVSDYNVRHLSELAPRANVVRVYNGIDLTRFEPLPEPPSPAPARLLFVGRFVEKKGLTHLIDACAKLRARGREVACRLVGSGPLEEDLRRQAAELGLAGAVEFPGPASTGEVLDVHLPEASIFVMPAIVAADGDRDGLPTTLLESMARGVPVVSTRVTGIPEITDDGRVGPLAVPGDAEGLCRAIEQTLDESEATRARVRAARRRVEELFDARKNVAQLERVFLDVVSSGARAAGGGGL